MTIFTQYGGVLFSTMNNRVFKIILSLYSFWMKRIIKCRNLISSILLDKIAKHAMRIFPNHKMNEIHELSFYVRGVVLGLDMNADIDREEFYKDADIVINEVKNSEDIIRCAVDYYRVGAFLYSSMNYPDNYIDDFNKEIDMAIKINEKHVDRLDNPSFSKMYKMYKRVEKDERKDVRRIVSERITRTVDESIEKINIDSSAITLVIGMFSTIFIATGFVYNNYLLGHFGVDVDHYFTINDYISTSLDKLYYSLIPSLFGAATYLYGMYSGMKDLAIDESFNMNDRNADNFSVFVFFVVLISTISVIYMSIYKIDGVYSQVEFLMVIVIFWGVPRIPLHKFISNHFYVRIFLVILLMFLAYIYQSVNQDIYNIESLKTSDSRPTYYLSDGSNINNRIYNIITRNSEYSFFYSRKNKGVLILPNTDIKKVVINND